MTDLYKIKSEACKFFGITLEEFDSKKQPREIVKVRYMSMVVATKYTNRPYKEIGAVMSGKDHSTVNHAKKAVRNLCETDQYYNEEFKEFEKRIKLILKNKNINTIMAIATLSKTQFQGSGYYFTYKNKINLSLEREIKITAASIHDIERELNIKEFESISIAIISEPALKITSEFMPTNEPIDIEI